MTDQPNNRRDLQEVEYVEAEPIEGTQGPRVEQPVTYVRTYQGGGCVPCCGPIGCLAIVTVIGYLFFESEFIRAVALGLIIFVAVSFLAGSLTRRTR